MFDLASFSGRLPLFPLPNVVHFPHTLLPLHIFEPRYRRMIGDALEGERVIGMALLKPGWESNYDGSPEIHEIACLGEIGRVEHLDDGRYNLVLTGLARVRVGEIVSPLPYRTARVSLLEDRNDLSSWESGLALGAELRRIFLQIYEWLTEAGGVAPIKPPEAYTLGNVVDIVAGTFDFDVDQKQSLLQELDVRVRADRLMSLIRDLARSQDPLSRRRRTYPPKDGLN